MGYFESTIELENSIETASTPSITMLLSLERCVPVPMSLMMEFIPSGVKNVFMSQGGAPAFCLFKLKKIKACLPTVSIWQVGQ